MRNIEGRNPVLEALRAGTDIKVIYIRDTDHPRLNEIERLAKSKGVPVHIKPDLSDVSKTNRHQGVVAQAKEKGKVTVSEVCKQAYDEGRNPLIIVLSGVDYEHNLGSVMRSGECAGADAVILPKNTMKLSPSVVKASAGASEHIPFIEANLFAALKEMQKQGLKIIALSEKADKSIFNEKMDLPLCIITGKEDVGVSGGLEKYVDSKVRIPLKGQVESLNMAVATAVCLFEAVRQRLNT